MKPPSSTAMSQQQLPGQPAEGQQTLAGGRGLPVSNGVGIPPGPTNGNGLHIPNHLQSPTVQGSPTPGSQQQQPMNLGSEPFFLKQHYKDQLAYLERDSNEGANICNVWVYNFEYELAKIAELLKKYTFVAMDTEFPGFLESEFENGPEDQRQYNAIKHSVDKLKIIQLGITLSDEDGNLPKPVSTWQFNFDWDIDTERKAEVSINKLKECGLDFNSFKHHGISPLYFAEKVMTSGLVLNDRLTWICFHGNQDFGFLIKLMMNENLPATRQLFEKFLVHYIPNVLDIKSFMHSFNLYGGLEKIAKQLSIVRMGSQHQAGSDSLVTLQVLFRLFNNFETDSDRKNYLEVYDQYNQDLYGFSNDQAFHTTYPTEQPTMQIRDQIRSIQTVAYPPPGNDMHGQGHMSGHPVHHGVPLAANGQHLMMDQQLDGDYFHDQEPHDINERLMNNFRPNQISSFNQGRMQTPFDYMNQQQLQSLAGYHQQPPQGYLDHSGAQQPPPGMHGSSPGQPDQGGAPFNMMPPGMNIQQLLMAANQNGNLGQPMSGDYDRRAGPNGGQQLAGGQPWQGNQVPSMHDNGQGNGFFNPQYYQQN